MADASAIAATEFSLWLDELKIANDNVKTTLDAEELDEDELRTHFDDMVIASRELEQYRPVGKKVLAYDFTTAIPSLILAKRLSARVNRALKQNEQPEQQAPIQPSSGRKVPEVKVHPFSGDITTFGNFIVAFEKKFGAAPISPSEKLIHLQSVVQGGPGKLISSYAITDDNYTKAIEYLKLTYEKPSEVIAALYDKLKHITPATGNTASLSHNYYEIAGILAALESHGQDVDAFLPLRDDVSSKYPFHVVQAVSQNKFLSVTELQREILVYIQLKERSEAIRTPAKPRTLPPGQHGVSASLAATKHDKSQSGGGRKNTSDPPPAPSKPQHPCAFCAQTQHYSSSCPVHTTYEMRKELAKDRCVLCLATNHKKGTCKRTVVCHFCRAQNEHNSALCPQQFGKASPDASKPASTSKTAPSEESKASYFVRAHKGAHVTARVTIQNPITKQTFQLRALLDSGSNETYINEEAARRCGLQLTNFRTVPVTVFLKDNPVLLRTSTTHFTLTNGGNFDVAVVADTSKTLPQAVHLFDYDEFRALYPQYSRLDYVEQAANDPIELLIGGDYFYDIVHEKSTIAEGLHLQRTSFGWILVGRQTSDVQQRAAYFQMSPAAAIAQLSELESIGIAEMPITIVEEEERALEQFYDNIRMVDGRYEIRWPWRRYPPNLKPNLGLAAGRLKSMQKKLTPESFESYNEILTGQINSGIVAEMKPEEVAKAKYFLPHQVVLTPEKSTPIRLVYDGKAKLQKDKSINDEIYKGKNMLADNTKIVIRWRLYLIVSVSDLEKAFHQLRINEADTYYVCFLWIRDWCKPASGRNLRFLRFLSVVFGITASPFLLLATIRYHLQKYEHKYPKIVRKLRRDSFADNFATGFETEEEALEFYEVAIQIFADCGMNLRKWASNSAALRDVFTQPDRSDAISVLGVLWDQYEDKIKVKSLEFPMNDTLRTVLSTAAQFYDPVGWFSPITLTAKHFLREIHSTYAWDDSLSDEHRAQWYAIRTELQRATEQRQDRFQTSIEDDAATFTLHVFTDASIKACACTIYLRKEKENDVKSYLLLSKTKLAKLRNIPKLELIAVLLGVKALEYVRQAIQIDVAAFLWCDSKCALSWLSSQRILPLFIERQVEVINAAPQLEKRYVPSALNIADLPS